MFPLFLCLLAGAQTPDGRPAPDLVKAITAAIDRGRTDSLRTAAESRIRRVPADPAGQFTLATVDRLTYRHQSAETRFRALVASPAVDRPWRTWGLLGLASSLSQRHENDQALPVLARALSVADSTDDRAAMATALLGYVRVLGRTVPPDSIDRLVSRARLVAPADDTTLTALVQCAAAASFRSGNQAAADSMIERGIGLARTARHDRTLGRCLLTRAQIYETRGRQRESTRAMYEAIDVLNRTADLDGRAAAHQRNAFRLIQYTYGLANGRRHALLAIEVGRQSGNRLAQGYGHLNLAQLAVRVGDLREAGRQLDSAQILLKALGDRPGLAARDFVAGDAAFAAGRTADAETGYRRSLEGYRRLGSPVGQVLTRLALVAIEQGRPDEAVRHLDAVEAEAARLGATGFKSDRHYYDGLVALRRGDGVEAASRFRRYRQGVERDAYLYRMDAGLREAEALTLAGRLGEAELALDTAFAMIDLVHDSLRGGVTNRDILQALAATRRFEFDPDLGLATTINRLATGGRPAAALRFAEAERARNLWIRMTRRGLLSRDSADLRPRGRIRFPAALSIDELRRTLDQRTAIVEYVTGAGNEPTTVFVISREGFRTYSAPPADSLAPEIERFVGQVAAGGWPKALARTLGRRLLDSAVAALPVEVVRLVVIPDGPLYRLPFDAVITASGAPLIERFEVSSAPSARLAGEWLAGELDPRPGPGHVIAFGDARFPTSAGLPRLPGSAVEAREAVRRGAGGQALLGPLATEAAVKRPLAAGATILHLATHARTEDWGVLTSAVYLTPGDGEDGRLGPEEIAQLRLGVDLVVLSGCRTSGGTVVFGEGIQGLIAPFLEAGAKAVVATYWEIGDRQIVPLMARFYQELRAGRDTGSALRSAKIAAYRRQEPVARWAALSLTGNPGVRPLGSGPPH